MSRRRLAVQALASVGLLLATLPAAAAPRLVVVVAVDQLRPDRLGPELPGGLGRLVREGRVYAEAVQDHAVTETCPGHATILTGRHPGAAGIPGNNFFDAERSRVVYCAEDPSPDAAVLGVPAPAPGRSPRLLRTDTLGDWMRGAGSRSRVFGVSGKDRAAIMLAGRRPDGAWWFQGAGSPGFTTSRYYRPDLPAWVRRFNDPAAGFLAGLPPVWEHASEDGQRPDDYRGESDRHSRTSAHPLRSADPSLFARQLLASPFIDDATLAFSLALVARQDLGRGPATDLLAVSLSGTDVVGHHYGPFSLESRDALDRLDRSLGAFLTGLERRVGRDGLLVVLTADHGVLPLPEWLEDQGRATCPVAGGRIGLKGLGLRLLTRLHLGHGFWRWPRSWLLFAGSQVAVKRPLAEGRGVDPGRVARATESWLERQPGVAAVWSPEEIRAERSETARLYRNSYDPERSGDLFVQVAEGCLISAYDTGTTHGTPYLYDRRVPLLFWGSGIQPGAVAGPARTIDVAPTLAGVLGVPAPPDLDGSPLF